MNNAHWKNNELVQRPPPCPALIAGIVALIFYSGFMLLGIFS